MLNVTDGLCVFDGELFLASETSGASTCRLALEHERHMVFTIRLRRGGME